MLNDYFITCTYLVLVPGTMGEKKNIYRLRDLSPADAICQVMDYLESDYPNTNFHTLKITCERVVAALQRKN